MNNIKKNVLLSATALGLVFSFNANADTTITKEALLADLNDTTYTDGSFDTSMGKQYVSGGDWSDEYAQYTFDSNNDGEADASLSGKTLGDTSIDFTQEAFQFTDQNGDTTDLSVKPTGLNTTDFDKAATIIAAEVGASSHSGNNLGTTTTVTQDTYSYMADTTGTGTPTLHTLTDNPPALTDFSKTITLTGSQNHDDVVVTGDSDDGMPQQSDYTFTITKADSTESGTISWVKTGSSYTINASVEGDLDNDADMAAAIAQAKVEFQAYSNDVTAFNNAKTTNATNFDTATSNYDTVTNAYTADVALQESITTNYDNYTTSYSTADTNRTAANNALNDTFTQYTTDVGNYTTAKAAVDAYDNSISSAVDNRSQNQISESLKDGGAVKTAIDGAVQQLADGAVADNTTAIATLNGDANTDGSVAHAIDQTVGHAADDSDPSNPVAATGLFKAVDTLNGDEETAGSVAYAVKQLADGAVADNTTAIATLNGDEETVGSVAHAVAQETSRAKDVEGDIASLGYDASDESYTGNLGVKGSSIAGHLTALDNRMGQIHGLAAKIGDANGGKNLGQNTTVEEHLTALAGAIGDRTNYSEENYIHNNETVAQSLDALDVAMGDMRSDFTKAQASNEARFDAIDHRISSLRNEMREGLAATAALAGLVPLDNTYKSQLSMAMGGYENKQAVALGGFHYLKENIILNAGVSYGGSHSTAYKVGVTFGF